jgi:hypothetical protein
MTDDGRYPYTYAADLIRTKAGYCDDGSGTKLSRSDASQIRQLFSEILGIPDEELAKKLADYYKVHEEELTVKGTASFLETLKVELGKKNLFNKDVSASSKFSFDERNSGKTFTKHTCACGGKCSGKA